MYNWWKQTGDKKSLHGIQSVDNRGKNNTELEGRPRRTSRSQPNVDKEEAESWWLQAMDNWVCPTLGLNMKEVKKIEEECPSDTLGLPRQNRPVTFSLPEFSVQPLMDEDGGNDLELDTADEKLPTVAEGSQEEDKENESVKNGCNPSASEDKQEVLGLPVFITSSSS